MWSSGTGTVGIGDELPACDSCGQDARYDTPGTPWALPCFLCPDCWSETSNTHLGPGESTYLMLLNEVPTAVREVCDALTDELHRPSLWS